MSNEAEKKTGNFFELLRPDLQQSMRQSLLDPQRLSALQRILLTTDGTVTEILEAYFSESMRLVKIYQDFIETEVDLPFLELAARTRVLLRKILLRGKVSHKNYLYAESIILPDRLDDRVRQGLLTAQKPIGQLMIEDRMETFREILTCKLEPDAAIADYFGVPAETPMISRTYRVFAARRPFLLITEKFPETLHRAGGF